MSATGDAALRYVRRGLPVLPLHTADEDGRCSCGRPDCPSPGKHPRTQHGVSDATSDEATVRRWWEMWPEANVGIRMGAGRVALDVDRRSGGDAALESLQAADGRDLPDTAKVATGGGWHYYFKAPAGTPSRTLAPGVELKGEGTYVVAPPSIHASGKEYTSVADVDPAQAPAWLLEDATRRRNSSAPPVEDAIPEGERNTTLVSLGGSMRRRGMDAAEIGAALQVTNQRRCDPPLDDDEVQRIAESLERYPPEEGSSGPERYDPQTGRPLAEVPAVERLSRLLEVVEVRRVVCRRSKHSDFVFTVVDPRTGEERKTRGVDSDDILVLSKLQAALYAVTLKTIPAPTRNTEKWRAIQEAIDDAAEVVDVNEQAEEWRFRLGKYLTGRVSEVPQVAAESGEPFERDGSVFVYLPAFQEYLRLWSRMRAETKEVTEGLRELGFKSDQGQNYTKPNGKRGNRSYWKSPPGWTW